MMNDLQPERVSLMYLNLNNNELSYPSIVKLEPILKFGHLLDLRLSQNKFNDKSMEDLSIILHKSKLQKIDLS